MQALVSGAGHFASPLRRRLYAPAKHRRQLTLWRKGHDCSKQAYELYHSHDAPQPAGRQAARTQAAAFDKQIIGIAARHCADPDLTSISLCAAVEPTAE